MASVPCKKCNSRTIDCHSNCKDYKAFKEELERSKPPKIYLTAPEARVASHYAFSKRKRRG